MRTLIRALLTSAVVAGALPAQGRLDGVIREQRTLLGIACYPVSLIDSTEQRVATTHTTAGGRFSLPVPRSGTYRLIIGHSHLIVPLTPALVLRGDSALTRYFSVPLTEGTTPLEFVNAMGTGLPGSAQPKYPGDMLERHYEGDVVMAFVVDTGGVVDSSTAIPLRATHTTFLRAVERALPGIRYHRWTSRDGPSCFLAIQRFEFKIDDR